MWNNLARLFYSRLHKLNCFVCSVPDLNYIPVSQEVYLDINFDPFFSSDYSSIMDLMFAAQAQAAAVAAAQYYANMSAVSQAQPIPGGMPGGPGLVVTSVAPPPPPTVSNIAFAPAPPAPPILSGTQVLGPQFLVNQPQQPQMHHHIQERYT